MSRSRVAFVSLAVAASLAAIAAQVALPDLLSKHVSKLTEAKSLSGKVTVQPLPGTPREVTFKFAKPNFFKVEDEEGFVQSDGTSLYTYVKSSNSYTVEPMTPAALMSKPSVADVWVWMPFLDKDACKALTSAKTGAKRTVKGTKVTEVMAAWEKPTEGNATIYFADNGDAKGFNLKNGDKEALVLVDEYAVSDTEVSASEFAFSAPAGSKKVEAMEVPKAGFAAVKAILSKNCMPCHSSQGRKAGIDLSSYDGIMGSQGAVVAGEPEHSGIYTTTSGPRASMPKGGPKLTEAQTKVIYEWIKNGAKNE